MVIKNKRKMLLPRPWAIIWVLAIFRARLRFPIHVLILSFSFFVFFTKMCKILFLHVANADVLLAYNGTVVLRNWVTRSRFTCTWHYLLVSRPVWSRQYVLVSRPVWSQQQERLQALESQFPLCSQLFAGRQGSEVRKWNEDKRSVQSVSLAASGVSPKYVTNISPLMS